MLKLIAFIEAYKNEENGATAIEYALIAAGVAVAVGAGMALFGPSLEGLWTSLSTNLDTAAGEL
jgi:pilus assembly protein Flp/PilA|tara:strand:+ start:392 stop:583 length:192 start_codon:yes stop_codon:yes gene_type:complete